MRALRVLLALISFAAIVITVAYKTIPTENRPLGQYDAIIVLGDPANADGTPAPEQRERVLEGIREYRAHVAPRLIMTGGAAHNRFVEAHVMAEIALKQGIPASDVIEEGQAQNTIQNIYYSAGIMHQNGWRAAEIVSSPSHIPRAALILQTFNRVQPKLALDWKTHAAPWPVEYSLISKFIRFFYEADYCLMLRVLGFRSSRFLPTG